MAKIFETPIDAERDRLVKQAQKAHTDAQYANAGIWSGITLSLFGNTLKEIALQEAERTNKPASSFKMGVYNVGAWLGLISGAISLVTWWNRRNEAIKAEAKLSVLGPEVVQYPIAEMNALSIEGKHCDRLKQEVASCHTRPL